MSFTKRVSVTDFDGTMTHHDFYTLAESQLLPSGVHDYWSDYRAGKLTHFEALRAYFAAKGGNEGQAMYALYRRLRATYQGTFNIVGRRNDKCQPS